MTYVAPGLHLLIDFWDCTACENLEAIGHTMQEAAEACGATVLAIRLHHFGEGAGVTGVAVLAESHISIHTWPETGYVAIDVFMCGACNPHNAIDAFKRLFQPARSCVTEHRRGVDA